MKFAISKLLVLFMLNVLLSDGKRTSSQHDQVESKENPLLALISFDGFRWDYLNMYNLTNFNAFRDAGSHATFIYNSFATVTFPNHWTLVTGLYEETHGIIQNSMYDRKLNKTFIYTSKDEQTSEWYGQNSVTEPIWTTNQRGGNGRRSAAEWVGAGVEFANETIIHIPYEANANYEKLFDKFISLFKDPNEPINFAAIYFDEPDHTGHLYGPESKQMNDKLQYLDSFLAYMMNRIRETGLDKKLNIIITSDHGMDKISEPNTIFLEKHIDLNLFDAYGSRAVYSLFVKKEKDLEFVYNTLKNISNVDVFKKEDIPQELNYKNNVRVGDILLVAHIGHAIYIQNQTVNWTINNGDHGYYTNISSMHPIFMAQGPAFKNSYKIPSFRNVDIYPLMCHILNVPAAVNNGTLERVMPMLVMSDTDRFKYFFLTFLLAPIILVTLTAMGLCLIKRRSGPSQVNSSLGAGGYSIVGDSQEAIISNMEEGE